jgi:hypothetical protein
MPMELQISPLVPERDEEGFLLQPETWTKGLRKNNFTFLTEPTCSSNQARSCGE